MLTTEIADFLRADTELADTATGGIYDVDVRRTGWESAPDAFDEPYGDLKPLLMVDDAGAVKEPFGSPVDAGTVYVWGMGPRTEQGRADVAAMLVRALVLLHRWQGTDGTTLFRASRLGMQSDDDGVFDRIALKAASVPPVAW